MFTMVLILFSLATVIFLLFAYATVVSIYEKEKRATSIFLLITFFLPLPYFLAGILNFPIQFEIGLILIAITLLIPIILIIPVGRKRNYQQNE